MSDKKCKRNLISKYFELPSGILSGGARIELQSNQSALIDCKCTILQYSETEIKINTGSEIIAFTGENLTLDSLNTSTAYISGNIEKLEFLN